MTTPKRLHIASNLWYFHPGPVFESERLHPDLQTVTTMSRPDPNPLDPLRKLPNHSLFDLALDDPGRRSCGIDQVLRERGLSPDEIAHELTLRGRKPRGFLRIKRFRQAALACTAIVGLFNLLTIIDLATAETILKGYLFLIMGSMLLLGLYLGLKLNTLLYLGTAQQVHCGFPCPIATIDVDTGEERLGMQFRFYFAMTINALVAVNLTLVPATLASRLLT